MTAILLCLCLAAGASGQRRADPSRPADPLALAALALPSAPPIPTGTITCPPVPASPQQPPDFLTCQYVGPAHARMTFYLYLPRDYAPARRYPLVLLLHGVGESAQPNQSPERNRDLLLTDEYAAVWGPGFPAGGPSVQDRWPCFVVVPQVVSPQRWVNVPSSPGTYHLLAQPSPSLLMAVEIVELLRRQYTSVDADRLYLTGLSMGAFGVWDALERWPSLFAAAVPLSGAGDPTFAPRIAQVALWNFHGAQDTIAPVEGSRAMMAALRAAGGNPCYTEIPDQGHSIWGMVYGLAGNLENPLYPWLFAQRQGKPPTACPTWDLAAAGTSGP